MREWGFRAALLATVLVMPSCAQQGAVCAAAVVAVPNEPAPTLPVVGHDLELLVNLQGMYCAKDLRGGVAKAEVSGPDGQPVEASASVAFPVATVGGAADGLATRVRFHAAKPGPYHVEAELADGMGVGQADTWAFEDRRGPPLRTEATPGARCNGVESTRSGMLVCRLDDQLPRFYRNAVELDTHAAMRAEVFGDQIWVYNSQGFLRLTDTGAGELAVTAKDVRPYPADPTAHPGWTASANRVAVWIQPGVQVLEAMADGGAAPITTISSNDGGVVIPGTFAADGESLYVQRFEGPVWESAQVNPATAPAITVPAWGGRGPTRVTAEGKWFVDSAQIRFDPFDRTYGSRWTAVPPGYAAEAISDRILMHSRTHSADRDAVVALETAADGGWTLGYYETDEGFFFAGATGDELYATRREEVRVYRLAP